MEETQTGSEGASLVPDEIESRLQGLTDEELFAVASRARKIAYGRRDPQRKEGAEGRRWLVAHRSSYAGQEPEGEGFGTTVAVRTP